MKIGQPPSALRRVEPAAPDAAASPSDGGNARETAALAALYRREAPGLARTIARRRALEDPEDLVQDAFVRLVRLPRGLASLDVPGAYLRRIAGNLLRDRGRSDARRCRASHVPAGDDTLPSFDPHKQLESRDMLRRVEAAIERLPDRTREIFVAHRIEGLSYAEIAERTGLSVKGVEKQMSKALVRIDRLMARD